MEIVFRVPDLTLLPCVQEGVTKLAKMSVVELKNLSKDDLKKRLAQQIDIEDWTDKCGKCGYPKLLHKELHREAACTREQEVRNVLNKNCKEYTRRIKPS